MMTPAEVEASSSKKNVLIIINDCVYKLDDFLDEHPGGEDTLLEYLGKDATEAFNETGHSKYANRLLEKFKVAELAQKEKKGAISENESEHENGLPKISNSQHDYSSLYIFISSLLIFVFYLFTKIK